MPNEYKLKFYVNSRTGEEPAVGYVENLDDKSRAKVKKYTEFFTSHLSKGLLFYCTDTQKRHRRRQKVK